MMYDVILSKNENKYLARVREWPEIMASANKRDEVIQQVQTKLFDFLSQQQVEVVQVEVPLTTLSNNPWLDKFGLLLVLRN